METICFMDRDGTFTISQPENYSYLYFPVAGENGIKVPCRQIWGRHKDEPERFSHGACQCGKSA